MSRVPPPHRRDSVYCGRWCISLQLQAVTEMMRPGVNPTPQHLAASRIPPSSLASSTLVLWNKNKASDVQSKLRNQKMSLPVVNKQQNWIRNRL
jgi:hypothetical protein